MSKPTIIKRKIETCQDYAMFSKISIISTIWKNYLQVTDGLFWRYSLFEYWASMLKTTYWIMRKTAAGNIEAEEALLPNQAKIPHGLTLELLSNF